MKAVLGIGNPGREYEGTRHNCGFDVVDKLLAEQALSWETNKRWQTQIALWRSPGLHDDDDGKVLLLRPTTFVNGSGATAQAVCAYYKLQPTDLLVVVDDIHLKLGDLRLRGNGSSGGHNGLKDIERHLGRNYPRLRCGIGSPNKGGDAGQVGHVLGRFSESEREDHQAMIAKACSCVRSWLDKGLEASMSFNGPLRPPAPKPKRKPKAADTDAGEGKADPTVNPAKTEPDTPPPAD